MLLIRHSCTENFAYSLLLWESNYFTCVLVLDLLNTLGQDKTIRSDVAQQIKNRVDGVYSPFRTHQLFCGCMKKRIILFK